MTTWTRQEMVDDDIIDMMYESIIHYTHHGVCYHSQTRRREDRYDGDE
jgi:hypothetical protein